MIGLVALALMGGAVALTGVFLTGGGIGRNIALAHAEFSNCGQGLRTGGDVKLRGVLVGRIGDIERVSGGNCRVAMELFPESLVDIPSNVAAQVRAKTIFGEKWVELTFPEYPSEERFAAGDEIPASLTLNPLEIETILNTALPLLDAVDPEYLAGALQALAEGFVGHEDAAIAGINEGIDALKVVNDNEALVKKGIDVLAEGSKSLEDIDDDLIAALNNLDDVNRFTTANENLIAENFRKAPLLLRELAVLFQIRFVDLVKLVDRGATVLGVVSQRTGDVDRLLDVLPIFNSNWIKNLDHVCRFRQPTDEPGKATGDAVPGRCWRVHNILSESQGAYPPGKNPRPRESKEAALSRLGLTDVTDLARLLYTPALPSMTLRGGGR